MLRGVKAFAATPAIHTLHQLRVAEHLPVPIAIVDSREQITSFPGSLDSVLSKGAVVLRYARSAAPRTGTSARGGGAARPLIQNLGDVAHAILVPSR